jgi:hypothetical protein
VQLFRVSKQVYAEARKVFLSQNTFVILNSITNSVDDDSPLSGLYRDTTEMQMIRRLSISLDYRSYPIDYTDILVQCGQSAYIAKRSKALNEDHAYATTTLHDTVMEQLQDKWNMLLSCLGAGSKLDYLQINLQNCYCPLGCHRVAHEAFQWPASLSLSHRMQLGGTLDIIGTESKDERDFFREMLAEIWNPLGLLFHGTNKAEIEDGIRGEQWDPEAEIGMEHDNDEEEAGTARAEGVDDDDEDDESEDDEYEDREDENDEGEDAVGGYDGDGEDIDGANEDEGGGDNDNEGNVAVHDGGPED